jgi:hypothetical protein
LGARRLTAATKFFLFGAANTELLHIFVMSYFGFGEFAVLLYNHGYRQSSEAQAKYNN